MGGPIQLSTAVVASWARYSDGVDEQGQPINIVDRLADRLHERAARQRQEPLAFVSDREVFGDLVDEPVFVAGYLDVLDSLYAVGARATLEKLVSAVSV